MSIADDLIASLARLNLSQAELSRRSAVPQSTISRFMQGRFGAEPFLRFLDALGARVVFPGDINPVRDTCFVNATLVTAGPGDAPPAAEDYLAVPLVTPDAIHDGPVASGCIESWVLVYRNHRSVLRRDDLLAVEIGHNQRGMIPTLHPGDIVLVDRGDQGQTGFSSPGNIFLVREPNRKRGGEIRRVAFSGKEPDAILTFYGDNVTECEPQPHPFSDYGGNIRAAVIGRVVWAWADLSRK